MAQENKPNQKILFFAVLILALLIVGVVVVLRLFGGQGYRVALVDAPREVNAGAVTTFTWRIDGPSTTINQTSVYFGTSSNPGELGEDVSPQNTTYTEYVTDFIQGGYDIPLQFVGNTKPLLNAGSYFFRVHAVIDGKNYWSDEYTFEVVSVEHSVSVVNGPSTVVPGTLATFTWSVNGLPTTINYTAVHFGRVSTPGVLGKYVAPDDTEYTDLVTEFAQGEYDIPFRFVGNARIATAAATGTYYFRGHALINGENYWTDEDSFEVEEVVGVEATSTPVEVVSPPPPSPTPEI